MMARADHRGLKIDPDQLQLEVGHLEKHGR